MPPPPPAPPVLAPCVIPTPVSPVPEASTLDPVATLANTGLDATSLTVGIVVAVVLVVIGVVVIVKMRHTRGRITALAIPLLLIVGGLALAPPPSAFAAAGAPTALAAAQIQTSFLVSPGFNTVDQISAATFDNPEGCGILSYQWQSLPLSQITPWTNTGPVLVTPAAIVVANCSVGPTRLLTTLVNSSGSVTSSSNEVSSCT